MLTSIHTLPGLCKEFLKQLSRGVRWVTCVHCATLEKRTNGPMQRQLQFFTSGQ